MIIVVLQYILMLTDLRSTLVVSLLLAFPLFSRADDRPNILFAFADDWGKYASAYAAIEEKPGPNTALQTPVFDRIAREGALFSQAYVTSPSCTPCRSSLLSGQYFWRTGRGAILQGAQWDSSIPSFPLLLKDSGYHIGQTYKVWSPGTPADAPYGEKKYQYESAGRAFNGFSQSVTRAIKQGQSIAAAKQHLYDEVMGNFQSFLDDRDGATPFCYWFGPTNVHRKWTKGSGKDLWGLDPDILKGKMPSFLPDTHEVREDLVDYFGEVMAFDTALGHLLKKLEDLGELDNTMVVVSGDHGAPGFPRGKTNLYDFGTAVPLAIRWPKGGVDSGRVIDDFVNLMDLAPTFCEAGGLTPPEVMTGRSVLNLLKSDRSGIVSDDRKWVITGRERHVAKAREDNLPYPQRAIRTRDFLYVRNFKPERWPQGTPTGITSDSVPTKEKLTENTFATLADVDAGPTKAWMVEHRTQIPEQYELAFGKRPAEELYDLKNDPDQVANVATDPAYAATLKHLSNQLINELKRTGDPRVTGDGSTYDKPPFAGK
ncbi:MAG: N-sulfoglucosamine sulfohydrolase [Verrucomicrobiales bacterium]|jgi:N-sulfoglucosamine sulfohydrolase